MGGGREGCVAAGCPKAVSSCVGSLYSFMDDFPCSPFQLAGCRIGVAQQSLSVFVMIGRRCVPSSPT